MTGNGPDWKKIGAGLAAISAAVAAFVGGVTTGNQAAPRPRVAYLQVRSVKEFHVDTPGWRSWKALVTYKDETGAIERGVPITLDVELP